MKELKQRPRKHSLITFYRIIKEITIMEKKNKTVIEIADYRYTLANVKRGLIKNLEDVVTACGGTVEFVKRGKATYNWSDFNDCPCVAASPRHYDDPTDVYIASVSMVNGHLEFWAFDKNECEEVKVDTDDLFVEHICFITETILEAHKEVEYTVI